jgi:transposase
MAVQDFRLTENERESLTILHKGCIDKKTADRIKAILLVDKGYTYQQIEEILLIDERTLGRYKKAFQEKGIPGLVSDNYKGGFFKLSDEQISLLKEELDSKPYSTAQEICAFVMKQFKITYTAQGMVQTLHRLGYSYKKTSPVPGKIDKAHQQEFVKMYEAEYKTLPGNEKVYFLDGCHPTFNNHFGYAWIKKGTDFPIKTQDGRKHLNLMGAYNPKDQETFIRTYDVLNRDAVIDFLKQLRVRNKGKKLHVIWDNVPYQHAAAVKQLAKEINIELVYLPPYSPNLNLIERYWGFLRKKTLRNQHFETFEEFSSAIMAFSRKRSRSLRDSLRTYIPERFHILEPVDS